MAKRKTASRAASTQNGSDANTAAIRLRLFDGVRAPIDSQRKYLVRLLDGQQQQLLQQEYRGAERSFNVPFHDNFLDAYAIIVTANDCRDVGFFPVTVNPTQPVTSDLILVPKDPQFDFSQADWDLIQQTWPKTFSALSFGVSAAVGRQRYDALVNMHPQAAAFWNIMTAMRDVDLPQGTVLDYVRQVIFDAPFGPAQDRFFAFAEVGLVDQVVTAADHGTFAPEPNPGLFHPDATRSFKQIAFGEANLQLTFHEKVTKKVNGETWVRIEPDIDYFKDLGAHALLEVVPNAITGAKTDPVAVYILRWIAGRHAGVPEFDPPYILVGP